MKGRARHLDELRRCKADLQARYGDRPWFRGVGIAPSGSDLVLRLSVDPAAAGAGEEIPREYRGHRIDIVYIGGYERR